VTYRFVSLERVQPGLRHLIAAAVALLLLVGDTVRGSPRAPAVVVYARGLQAPVDLTAAPGGEGKLYVVEQRGRIRIIDRGRVLRRPFLDIRGRVRYRGNIGMFSLAFDPLYRRNHFFYVYYAGRQGNVWLVRFRSRRGVGIRSTARVLLHVRASPDPFSHDGGGLTFGPGGYLYLGVGDGFDNAAPQDLDSLLGKILRIDVRHLGEPPAVVAFGLREPWRFSFDGRTGDLYIGDVGGTRWEEIDYVANGQPRPNFGWSVYEGPTKISSRPLTDPAALTLPLFAYRHPRKGCAAVVGGFVYRGRRVPSLRGRYVFGDLCTGVIKSFRVVAGKATDVRRFAELPTVLASFGRDSRGELYAVSVNDGVIFRLER
jgi:glucose/arabinose dehydrogenase